MAGRSENPELLKLIHSLRKKSNETKAAIWQNIAERIKSRNKRASVNLSHISRYTHAGETVIVPGKVLGAGKLHHSVKVAALQFSKQAEEKIIEAKGKCMTINELMEKSPKNVKIIG